MPMPERSSRRRLAGYAVAALAAILLVVALPTIAAGTGPGAHAEPRILSASWGTDNAVGCPSGEQGLDNIPVTFTCRESEFRGSFPTGYVDREPRNWPTPFRGSLSTRCVDKEPRNSMRRRSAA